MHDDFMRHLRLLTDGTDLHGLMWDFNSELDSIIGEHRFLTRTAKSAFADRWNAIMNEPSDGGADGGDVFDFVQGELGINPFDVEGHAGLAALSRAVSLTEVTLARMAAHRIKDPEVWVFPRDGLWPRQWEGLFFKTILNTPFSVSGFGFGSLRDLRDLYSHGYGVPATEERRNKLAARLFADFKPTPPTPKERALGYTERPYWFGRYSEFNSKRQVLEADWFESGQADVSELACYRALEAIRAFVAAAEIAVAHGYRAGIDETNNKYVKVVSEWWAKQGTPLT